MIHVSTDSFTVILTKKNKVIKIYSVTAESRQENLDEGCCRFTSLKNKKQSIMGIQREQSALNAEATE